MKKQKIKKEMEKKNKAQLTIFIIVALVIVVGIALIFLLKKGPTVHPTTVVDEENPQGYIEGCTKSSVEEAVNIIVSQGGDLKQEGSIMYQGKNVTYLCYNANFYYPCINQRPMLIKHIQEGITTYVNPKINSCFSSLKAKLEGKGYSVEMGNIAPVVELQPNLVVVNMNTNFKMSNGETTKSFDNFKVAVANPIYDFAWIGSEIASQEAKYCYFNTDGFNSNYPGFEVRKDMIGDSKIYSITKTDSDQKFILAIRGCVMPRGF